LAGGLTRDPTTHAAMMQTAMSVMRHVPCAAASLCHPAQQAMPPAVLHPGTPIALTSPEGLLIRQGGRVGLRGTGEVYLERWLPIGLKAKTHDDQRFHHPGLLSRWPPGWRPPLRSWLWALSRWNKAGRSTHRWRLRAYWWWLNGNVTKAAITRDLEEMKKMGWGGALICDADGASQDGNDPVRHGPDFLSTEWRALFQHACARPNGLARASLNIQSGWNLGGPPVTADDAAKKLVWSEVVVEGPTNLSVQLPEPRQRDGYYRDLFVSAYPIQSHSIAPRVFTGLRPAPANRREPSLLIDGDRDTFWVSAGTKTGQGRAGTARLGPIRFRGTYCCGRVGVASTSGYGPRECELQVSDDGRTFGSVKAFPPCRTTRRGCL